MYHGETSKTRLVLCPSGTTKDAAETGPPAPTIQTFGPVVTLSQRFMPVAGMYQSSGMVWSSLRRPGVKCIQLFQSPSSWPAFW